MAGAQTVFSVLFEIQAKLNGNFNNSFANAQNAARRLQTELSGINSLQGKIGGYQKQAEALDKNRAKLETLTEQQARLQEKMRQTAQPTEALKREYDKVTNKIAQTNASIQEQERSLNALGDELREAGVNTDDLTGENERLADSYERIRQNQERLSHIADAQQKNKAAISATKAQLVGTVGAISAVGAAIYAGPVQKSIEFQSSMAKVGTIADATKVPLDSLRKDIVNLSNDIGVNANAIAEDVYNAISAGQSTENAVGFVGQAVKLAKGGFAETGQALDVMTTILNAYGLESEKASTVADMLIQTQNKGKVTVSELSSVMGKIIPTAKSQNVALEQVCAGYAIMTAKGIAAAETTTYMNSMLNEMGKTGSKADKALREVGGGSFKELMGQGKSLAEVLDILDGAAKKGGVSLADMFGSAEAGKAALTLMDGGVEGFNAQVAGMIDSTGAAQAAFEQMGETTEEKIAKAKNALNNLAIILGDTFLPYVTTAAQKVAGLVQTFSAWAQENPELLKTLVKIGAGVAGLAVGGKAAKLGFLEIKGGVLAVQGAFTSLKAMGGIKGIIGNAGGMKGIFGGIGSKLLPIIGIVTAIGVAIKLVSGHIEEVRGFIQRTFGDTGLAVFDKVWSVITNIGNALKGVFSGGDMSGARDFFQNTFGSAGVAAFDAVIGVVEQLKAALPPLLDQLGQMAAAVFPALMSVASALVSVIAQVASAILPVIVSLIAQLLPIIIQIASAVLPVLMQVIQTLVPMISEVVNAVLPVLISALNTILPIISQITLAVLPVFQQILQALIPIIQVVADALVSGLSVAVSSAQTIINGFLTVLQGIITFITGVFTGNWRQAWEGVKQIFSGAMESLKGIVKAPINFIINALNTLIGGLNNIKIPSWVPGVGGKGINIPKIPMLAKGSRNTPDIFIAGEKGPELITNSKGRTVFTALQTERILSSASAAAPGADAIQQVVVTIAPALLAALSRTTGRDVGSNRAEPPQTAAAQKVVINLAPALTAALTAPQAPNGGSQQPQQQQAAAQAMGSLAQTLTATPAAPDTRGRNADAVQVQRAAAVGNLVQTLAAPAVQNMVNGGAAQAQTAAAQQVIVNLAPAMAATLAAAPAMATVQNSVNLPEVQAAELQQAPPRQSVFNFNSNPVFNVNGGDVNEMQRICKEWHDQTLQDTADMIQQAEDDERRGRYE